MSPLTFKTKYIDLIKSREKIQTIRPNNTYYSRYKTGDSGFATNYREYVHIIINKIIIKNFDDLNNRDAKLDGFSSLDFLKETLMKTYSNKILNLIIIRFSVQDI